MPKRAWAISSPGLPIGYVAASWLASGRWLSAALLVVGGIAGLMVANALWVNRHVRLELDL